MNLLKRTWKIWQAFGHFMGNFIARFVLTIFYFIIFAPFAIVTQLLLDPLGRKPHQNKSLWLDQQTRDLKLRDSKYQF